jgi:hypothetical protein
MNGPSSKYCPPFDKLRANGIVLLTQFDFFTTLFAVFNPQFEYFYYISSTFLDETLV